MCQKFIYNYAAFVALSYARVMGGGTGGYRGYMYPPPFLEGGTRGYTL